MASRIVQVEPFDLIVFGAICDLSQRKILPTLYHRNQQGQMPLAERIISTSRRPMSDVEIRAFASPPPENILDVKIRTTTHVDNFTSPA